MQNPYMEDFAYTNLCFAQICRFWQRMGISVERRGNMSVIRKHFRFTGRVQGVGFRYRAKYAAGGLGVTGWVKNEWDGSVEMEAQGTIEQINKMLVLINKSDYVLIENIESKEIPVENGELGFHIR